MTGANLSRLMLRFWLVNAVKLRSAQDTIDSTLSFNGNSCFLCVRTSKILPKLNRIKMKIILKCCFSLLFFFIVTNSFAQRPAVQMAEQAYAKGDYYDAAALYKKAFSKEKNKVKRAEYIFKVAESYRMTNDYKNQEVWYAKAIKANNKNPDAIIRLADALKMNGKYDEAIVQYQNFQKAAPEDPRGELGVQNAQQAQKWKDKPVRYRIENVAAINTKYSDFGVGYSNKDHRHIIFSSARQEAIGKNNDGWTGEKFQDMFEAAVDKKGKWSSPKPLLEPVNSNASEGGVALDPKGNDLYFTRCETEKGKIGVCDIYYTKRKGTTWDDPKIVLLGPDSATVGHPSLTVDEQTLYFASDMEGGFGGKDIWYTKWDKKTKYWGKAINAGPKINTEQDEMFPYVATDGTLYFSSKGHIGMGGLDIYKATQTNGVFDDPENMKYPLNSSHDDFAFVIDETTGDRGFISSDRDGGKGGDDIYSWYLPPLIFTVSGKVYDADTKQVVEGATIELFGSDGSSIPYKTDATGVYKFDLKPETSYKVSATMKDYLNKYMEVSTIGQEQSKDFIGDFDFALRSTLRAIELPEVYYDLAKWNLRPESNKALDGLVQTLNDNPTIVIEIGSHTDSRPIPMTNDTLSQRRAKSVVDYLIAHGIDKERLDYRGYGQTVPRTLIRDMGSFKAGDVMTDQFISTLKSNKVKEEAHQLNRRTEFKVLRTNYVKGQGATENINLQTPQATIVDSSNAQLQPVENTNVAGEVIVAEAAHSQTAADSAAAKPSGPGEIYVAKKNDTYNSIAKANSMTVKDLKTLNGLKGEQIYEGMELKVSMGGDYKEFDKKFYTVDKGENTWQIIAKKLDMKVSDLKKLNKDVGEDQLRPGKRIRITK
jgi:peptidoglycan-associated lipoprotein